MYSPIVWQKSSYSGGGADENCLEVGLSATGVHLRESDAPDGTVSISPTALNGLISAVKAGELSGATRR